MAVSGKEMPGHELIELPQRDRRGVTRWGQVVMAENRLVGMKSRGAYETPGGTIPYQAHKALEQLCLERDTMHFKQQAALRYAELVYYGQWFHPLREALQAFVDKTQEHMNGSVTLELYKGHATPVSARSDRSLYDPKLASFAMDGFDVTAGRGVHRPVRAAHEGRGAAGQRGAALSASRGGGSGCLALHLPRLPAGAVSRGLVGGASDGGGAFGVN